MFRHLLVPLDGSPLADAALPAARRLAERLGAEITLLHTIERNPPRTVHGQVHLSTAEDAEAYLAQLAERALGAGLRIERHVHTNEIDDVARSIVDHADELHVDLIVLCTHGAGGVRHGLFGTVAQRVIALGATPVLLMPTPARGDRPFSCRRLLVPLDGNPEHEHGLASVSKLAAEGDPCALLLLMVIPTWRHLDQPQLVASRTLPGTIVELLAASNDAAQAYLDDKTSGLKSAGCDVTTGVTRGEPVAEIVAAARGFRADLVVLGTHGTSHLDAFWSGSVTPRLSRQSQLPLLLVPVHDGN